MLKQPSLRQQEIVRQYLEEVDRNMVELKSGKAERVMQIQEFAQRLFVHPRHLSNTIYEVLGKSPCAVYEEKLVRIAQELLDEHPEQPIAWVAHTLGFDPSNFTKFFKRFAGLTPKSYRVGGQKSELDTI